MTRRHDWNDEDERPTNRGNKRPTDLEHTVGGLMAESLNHRRRVEILEDRADFLEKRISNLELSQKNNSFAPGSSLSPSAKQSLLSLVRKTVTTSIIIIAGILAAIKELGFLK